MWGPVQSFAPWQAQVHDGTQAFQPQHDVWTASRLGRTNKAWMGGSVPQHMRMCARQQNAHHSASCCKFCCFSACSPLVHMLRLGPAACALQRGKTRLRVQTGPCNGPIAHIIATSYTLSRHPVAAHPPQVYQDDYSCALLRRGVLLQVSTQCSSGELPWFSQSSLLSQSTACHPLGTSISCLYSASGAFDPAPHMRQGQLPRLPGSLFGSLTLRTTHTHYASKSFPSSITRADCTCTTPTWPFIPACYSARS